MKIEDYAEVLEEEIAEMKRREDRRRERIRPETSPNRMLGPVPQIDQEEFYRQRFPNFAHTPANAPRYEAQPRTSIVVDEGGRVGRQVIFPHSTPSAHLGAVEFC